MNRKTFLKKTAGAMLVAVPAYSFLACSSSDNGSDTPIPDPSAGADCIANGTAATIGGNHGHTITVSKADVQAAVDKTYAIQGSSGHGHNCTLTAANFNSLKSKTAISVTSTNDDGHTHSVSVSCA